MTHSLTHLDRFILPAGEPRIASFLHERLLAPHSLRERLRRFALVAVPALTSRLGEPISGDGHGPALRRVEAVLGDPELLRGTPLADRPARWLLVEDYEGSGRE